MLAVYVTEMRVRTATVLHEDREESKTLFFVITLLLLSIPIAIYAFVEATMTV